MLKVRVSYSDKSELDNLIRVLLPYVKDYKLAQDNEFLKLHPLQNSNGYKRAYIDLNMQRDEERQ